ncbi:MAG: Ku protein, partial [Chloroflexi bacterium]|nr:Ku protein [Chloroflexota bacterium]
EEIRPAEDLEIPTDAKITQKELDLAEQLLQNMTEEWDPGQYKDEYQAKLKKWINKKIETGATTTPEVPPEQEPAATQAEDIWETLMKSIAEQGEKASKKKTASRKKATTN